MKIVTIVGARPQFIKAAAVSRRINERGNVSEVLVHTGQHFDVNMSDVFFDELDIRKPDHCLGVGGGTHGQNTGRMLEAIEQVLLAEKPDWVLVYGDTDSTLAGALAAAKLHVPLAHVEAGLRSYNRRMPEEVNRVLTDHVSNLLLVPTDTAIYNLASEGINGSKVCLTGDVMYDAMLYYKPRYRKPENIPGLTHGFVLSTIHRAENTDDLARLSGIIQILNEISKQQSVILPIHPRTANAIRRLSDTKSLDSISIIDPVGYLEMNWLLENCSLVITDSGGLQKEAFFHRKPCITLRDETEWVELVNAGYNLLVSPFAVDIHKIFAMASGIHIPQGHTIYGKGDAGVIIVDHLSNYQE